MASFGENLRRERELRGVTLAELAEVTKVSLRYLTALEQDQFDQLPGGIFNRGFVRAIARYLGLDEREWVGAYARAAQEEPEILARYAPSLPPPSTARRSAATFVLLLILFSAALFAVHSVRTRRAAETIPALTSPTPATPATHSTLAQPASVSPRPVAEAAERQESSPLPLSAPSAAEVELHLQVFAIEDAWVSVSSDGRAFYEGLMKPGETRVFRAASKIDLRTGNASAMVLTLNGETLAPLGNPGEVKSISLTHKDLPPRP